MSNICSFYSLCSCLIFRYKLHCWFCLTDLRICFHGHHQTDWNIHFPGNAWSYKGTMSTWVALITEYVPKPMVLERTKKCSQIHDRYNLVNHVNMRISCLMKYATNISVTDWIIYGDRAGIQENQGICFHDTSISLPGSTCMLKSWHSSVRSLEMVLHLKSFVAGAVYCLYQ